MTASDEVVITVVRNEAILVNGIEVLDVNKTDKIIELNGEENSGGVILFSDSDDISSWNNGDIKVIPPSDKLPSGLAIKVSEINITESNASVSYATPTIDEVFEDASFNISTRITTNMIKNVKMSKGVDIQFSQKSNKGTREWFPDGVEYKEEHEGKDGNLIDSVKISLSSLIYENNSSGEKLKFNGSLNLSNMELDYKFENKAIPFKLENYLNFEYDIEESISMELALKQEASLSNVAPKMYQCKNFVFEDEGDNFKVEILGPKFEKSDICLGYVELGVASTPVKASLGGDGITDAPVYVRLYVVMGSNLKVEVKAALTLSRESHNKIGMEINTEKDDVFTAWNNTYALDDKHSVPKWKKDISGEISGEVNKYQGLAIVPTILGLTPAISRVYAGPKLEAEATASYGDDGLDGCFNVDLGVDYGFSVVTRFKADIELQATVFKWKKSVQIKGGFEYEYDNSDTLEVYSYDSCAQEEYTVSYKSDPIESDDYKIENILIKDSDNLVVTVEETNYIVYKYGIFITSGDIDVLTTLPVGDYDIKTIFIIDEDTGLKTSIEHRFTATTEYVLPIANAGSDQTTTSGTQVTLDATASTGNNITYSWRKQLASGSYTPELSTDATWTFSSVAGTTIYQLTVTDTEGTTAVDTVVVTATDAYVAPVANAGTDVTINEGQSVTLDASATTGENISYYQWSETGVAIYCPDSVSCTIEGLSAGEHEIKLTVSDGDTQSVDTVKVTVNAIIAPSTSKVLKTGQTTSYTNFDDGDYQAGVERSYTRVNDIVTDNVTGLQWQDDTVAKTVTKQWVTQANYDAGNYADTSGDTATSYCEDLSLGGYSDWRLPTRAELVNIVDYGRYNSSIDPIFENVASSNYWSSTTYAGYENGAWVVHFNYGNQNYYFKRNNHYVRCVRAGQ